MIYLSKNSHRASTNDDDVAAKFEELGYRRLTNWEILWQKIVLNAVLDTCLPLVAGCLAFDYLTEHGVVGFVVGWLVAGIAADLFSPLKRWD